MILKKDNEFIRISERVIFSVKKTDAGYIFTYNEFLDFDFTNFKNCKKTEFIKFVGEARKFVRRF